MPLLSSTLTISRSVVLPLGLWMVLSGSFFISCSSGDSHRHELLPNHAPVASNSFLVITVNVPLAGFLQASDSDSDHLTFRIVAGPSLGFVQLTDPSPGAFSYVSPTPGTDSFTFVASDGLVDSNIATVTITVNRQALVWQPVGQNETLPLAVTQVQRQSERIITAADPFNPPHQLAYTRDGGLLTRRDQGESWTTVAISEFLVDGNTISAIAFDEFVPGLVYIAINKPAGGHRLLRSTDGGATWRLISDSQDNSLVALVAGPLLADSRVVLYARLEGRPDVYQAIDYPY
jgi:hypothetical protein